MSRAPPVVSFAGGRTAQAAAASIAAAPGAIDAGRPGLLFVSPRFLFPADSGGKIRTRDILRGLKGGWFEITLACPDPESASARFRDELAAVCDRFAGWPAAGGALRSVRRLASLLSPYPVAVSSDRSPAGERVVAAELQRSPALVVADFPHSMVLLPRLVPHPTLLFTHNVEAEIFHRHAKVARHALLRILWQSQERKMRRFEAGAAGRVDAVVAVSERDAKYFRDVCEPERVFTIPTGVDLDYFGFQHHESHVPAQGGTLVFTGSMDWLANRDGITHFMDHVWPLIVRARPRTKMVVVGHSPPNALIAAARERGLPWTFTGFVDDIRPHVAAGHVYVIPLRVGGGTRIKAFEAMAMGRAVVSTSVGVEGLPVVAGRDLVIADSDADFAGAVVALLEDPSRRFGLARSARALVEERYSFRAAAQAFEHACIRAIELAERFRPGPHFSRG